MYLHLNILELHEHFMAMEFDLASMVSMVSYAE